MNMIDTAVLWVACGWIGLAVVAVIQLALWLVIAAVGKMLLKRLLRVYHLTVLAYWLDRLEREGLRTFQRPDEERK
jgi:hypothetical protein